MTNLPTEKNSTITIKEFCEITGFAKQTVLDNINRLYPDLMKNGVTTYLNEEQITRIKESILSHHNLTGTRAVSGNAVKTNLDEQEIILKAVAILQNNISTLKNQLEMQSLQLEAQAPKVEAYERFMDSQGLLLMRDIAHLLTNKEHQIGQNKLFELLRQDGYLTKKNIAKQEYIDNGFFKVIASTNDSEHIFYTTKATPKGFAFIAKKYYN
jgi:anti-repressor protein